MYERVSPETPSSVSPALLEWEEVIFVGGSKIGREDAIYIQPVYILGVYR
jgi:hypothetical protein